MRRDLEAQAGARRRQVVEVDGRDVARLGPLDEVLDDLADRRLEQVRVGGDHARVAPEDLEQLAVLEGELEVGAECRLDALLEREVELQPLLANGRAGALAGLLDKRTER